MRGDPTVPTLPGIKEQELVALGKCPVCGKPPFADGEFTFHVLEMRRAITDQQAVQRRVGLGMMLGNSDALAQAMGPDDDLLKIFDGPVKVIVHESCAMQIGHLMNLWPEELTSEKAT